jgi:hypothetical protein
LDRSGSLLSSLISPALDSIPPEVQFYLAHIILYTLSHTHTQFYLSISLSLPSISISNYCFLSLLFLLFCFFFLFLFLHTSHMSRNNNCICMYVYLYIRYCRCSLDKLGCIEWVSPLRNLTRCVFDVWERDK